MMLCRSVDAIFTAVRNTNLLKAASRPVIDEGGMCRSYRITAGVGWGGGVL